MADPDSDHGLVYTDDGILDISLSSFFDPEFGDDTTVVGYIERVRFLLKETIEAQLGINHWHQTLHPDTTLHPSYAALQRRLTSRSPQGSGTVVTTDVCSVSSTGVSTTMDDAVHLEKFNHNYLVDLPPHAFELKNLRAQDIEYLLVLDLEGKVEILEFPVVMIDAKTMNFIDSFHRFVRPAGMSNERVVQYIEGKYGKFGVGRVWHDTAILFKDVLEEFEEWLTNHRLWKKETGEPLHRAAFVTCGNWDLKTKIPQQCNVSNIGAPPSYFMEWINLKDIYLNFYNRKATGMMTMMRELEIPSLGSHHLGLDDTKNIARVLRRLLADGVMLRITARRSSSNPNNVEFLFKNRIV